MQNSDSWATAGGFLVKLLATMYKENGQASERDVRGIVQEEMKKHQSKEHMDLLMDIMHLMEEKKKEEKREEIEKSIQQQLEELSHKLDKLDRNKKVQENREWVKELVGRIADANAGGGRQPRPHSGGPRPNRRNYGPQNSNDHLPWMDGPKSKPNTFQKEQAVESESFVMVNPQDCSFSSRGRGNYRGGRGQYPRSSSQGRGNDNQQHGNATRGNYQHRGNYRGRGRGAIPKNSAGGKAPNEGELMNLNAKLENLSTTNVQVSLSPQEIITIKNALQSKTNSGKQPNSKSNQGNNNNKPSGGQQPSQQSANHPSGGRQQQPKQSANKPSGGRQQQSEQSAGRAQYDTRANRGGPRQQTGQRRHYDGGRGRQRTQEEEEGCSLM